MRPTSPLYAPCCSTDWSWLIMAPRKSLAMIRQVFTQVVGTQSALLDTLALLPWFHFLRSLPGSAKHSDASPGLQCHTVHACPYFRDPSINKRARSRNQTTAYTLKQCLVVHHQASHAGSHCTANCHRAPESGEAGAQWCTLQSLVPRKSSVLRSGSHGRCTDHESQRSLEPARARKVCSTASCWNPVKFRSFHGTSTYVWVPLLTWDKISVRRQQCIITTSVLWTCF